MERIRIASGVSQLDRLLGGLYIGDNVVWYDDAGSLASVFCLNFIQASQAQKKSIIYVCFDRSPKNLLEKLGSLADYKDLTILDCFTHGKGQSSEIFLKFYQDRASGHPCSLVAVETPHKVDRVMEAFYGAHGAMEHDVRFVFESLTGMQELWGGEEQLLKFYTHSCPRLYELNTVAYWIMEREAHSSRLKAQINQTAQVAIDLFVKRGKTSLTVLKAENRDSGTFNKPYEFWVQDLHVTFDSEQPTARRFDIGMRIKQLRNKRGISQTELAKLVGVTPSTISQVESNLIYPSLPALFKMAEVLSVEVSSLFRGAAEVAGGVVFAAQEAREVRFGDVPEGKIRAHLLTPLELDLKAEPYLIEVLPGQTLPSHFFIHKGEEMGYLLSGRLQLRLGNAVHTVQAGDVVYLTSEMPSQWKNSNAGTARLLWIKIK